MGLCEGKLPSHSWQYYRILPRRSSDGRQYVESQCISPTTQSGIYIQGNYHFMPAILTKLSPKRFGEGSTFTAVIRWDEVNLNQDNTGPSSGRQQQISFGLNYRPVEDTVFKISYQYLPETFNVNSNQQIHDQALVISAATYF